MALTGNHGIIIPRNKKLLAYLYCQRRMTLPEMGTLFGVDHKSILRVMRQLDIPTRGKGTSRHVECIEIGCHEPIHKIKHKGNGALYGRQCKAHRLAHRKKLSAHDLRRPEVRERRRRRIMRWYYKGPRTIKGEQQWIQHARRLLRAAKRLSVDPTLTPEVCLSQRLESKPDRTSQT